MTAMTDANPELREIVGAEYVAEKLEVHPYTALKWCRQGIVPGLLPRIGRRHRINRAVFDDAVAGGWSQVRSA